MDDSLRNGLWNALDKVLWTEWRWQTGLTTKWPVANDKLGSFLARLWHDYFRKTLDSLPENWYDAKEEIKSYCFSSRWYEVYDFLEFSVQSYPETRRVELLVSFCNEVLERDSSGYRLVQGQVAPVTSPAELEEIEAALDGGVATAREHLARALELMSDRESPDCRNSIKESVLAVEATVRENSGLPSATLAGAVRELTKKGLIHPALSAALSKLYGYCSDEGGIRHALKENSRAGRAEARFALVVCSAIVNFLSREQCDKNEASQ